MAVECDVLVCVSWFSVDIEIESSMLCINMPPSFLPCPHLHWFAQPFQSWYHSVCILLSLELRCIADNDSLTQDLVI